MNKMIHLIINLGEGRVLVPCNKDTIRPCKLPGTAGQSKDIQEYGLVQNDNRSLWLLYRR